MNTKFKILFLIPLLLLFLTVPQQIFAKSEQIDNYNVYIKVNKNRSLDIKETIKVYANGIRIKRGIYRTIPVKNGSLSDISNIVRLTVLGIKKDLKSEPYKIKSKKNTKIIYIGDKDVYLKKKEYTYDIHYNLSGQIRMFKNHDEVYQNINGTDWDFTIQSLTATVELPKGVKRDQIKIDGFTGKKGSEKKDFETWTTTKNNKTLIHFKVTKPLLRYEGLTVVIGFPKGYINNQTEKDILIDFIIANYLVISTIAIIIINLIVMFVYWYKTGKDPKGKLIVPQYEASSNISSAGVRYIHKMKFDQEAIPASLVNLAVKKIIEISKTKYFKITLLDIDYAKRNLYNEEKKLLDIFFKHGKSSQFRFMRSNSKTVSRAIKAMKKSLKKDYAKYVLSNSKYLTTPNIIMILGLISLISFVGVDSDETFFVVFATLWNYATYKSLYPFFSNIKGKKKIEIILPILFLLLTMGIGLTPMVALFMLNPFVGVIYLLLVIPIIIFNNVIKARTKLGRQVEDQSLGLKLYLSNVEKRRYESKLHKDIPKSLAVYEKYLPYAIALDIEPIWSKQFESELNQIKEIDKSYTSGINYATIGTIGNLGTAMTSSIISSSSSSSGSGFSGGSSGGGGGGGGGGGW